MRFEELRKQAAAQHYALSQPWIASLLARHPDYDSIQCNPPSRWQTDRDGNLPRVTVTITSGVYGSAEHDIRELCDMCNSSDWSFCKEVFRRRVGDIEVRFVLTGTQLLSDDERALLQGMGILTTETTTYRSLVCKR